MKPKFTILLLLISFLVFGQTAPSYYNGIDFTKTGNELKNQLATLITNTHTKNLNYSSELPAVLRVSDADPEIQGNILLIYGSESSGIHQRSRSVNGTWNKEHVYAKSLGTPNLGESGPGSDAHHLRPSDNTLNSNRGNLKFDDGAGVKAYKTSRGGWFPGDEWKGDVARMMMYMYVRYNTRCEATNIGMSPYTYSSDFPDIFVKWNIEDPVSNFERQRNNVVAQEQGNRNPFIDNPYLATLIWHGPNAENTWPDTINGGSSTDTEAPSIPTNLTVTGSTSSSVSLSWTASTDNTSVSGYDIYVDGLYKTTVNGTSVTVTGLNPSTTYSFYIKAKDSSGNISSSSSSVNGTTTAGSGGGGSTTCGIENFENMPANASSYTTRTWTNAGINWTATDARTDETIDNRAIVVRNGTLGSSSISGGIETLTVTTQLKYSGSSGTFKLFVNGVEKGTIPYSSTVATTTITGINTTGNIVISIQNNSGTSNRVAFDNLSWTCYNPLSTSEIEKSKWSIYPNPVKNNILFVNGKEIQKIKKVEIYTISGALVQIIENPFSKGNSLQLKNLKKGVYILKADNATQKFIVE